MVPAADEADPATAVGGRSPGHGEGIEFDDEPGWPRALVWLTRALHVAGALWTVAPALAFSMAAALSLIAMAIFAVVRPAKGSLC